MIGFFDLDLYYSNSLTLPNLELMKLARYYRVEEKIFSRLIKPDEEDFDGYDKIFVCSNNAVKLPEKIRETKKFELVGPAFTAGQYVPFENELIEYMSPRKKIYTDYLKSIYDFSLDYRKINDFLDNTYYRAYCNHKMLPLPPSLPRKKIFLYDDDFSDFNWTELQEKFAKRKPSSVICINPIFCKTPQEFYEIRKYQIFSHKNILVLDFNFSYNEWVEFLKKDENKLKAEIVLSSNIFIPFGGREKVPNTFFGYCQEIKSRLNLLYTFWTRNIPIKMFFVREPQSEKQPFKNLCPHIEKFSKRGIGANFSLSKGIKGEAKEELDDFLKYYPEQFSLFRQNYQTISKGGKWRYDG